jgi:hypothetical protein
MSLAPPVQTNCTGLPWLIKRNRQTYFDSCRSCSIHFDLRHLLLSMEPSPMYIIHFLIRQRKADMDPAAQHVTKTRRNNIQDACGGCSLCHRGYAEPVLSPMCPLRNLPRYLHRGYLWQLLAFSPHPSLPLSLRSSHKPV